MQYSLHSVGYMRHRWRYAAHVAHMGINMAKWAICDTVGTGADMRHKCRYAAHMALYVEH